MRTGKFVFINNCFIFMRFVQPMCQFSEKI